MKVGIVAPKNSISEMHWLLSFINSDGEPYQRGKLYDIVWFFNLSDEIKFIKKYTTSKIFAVAAEPKSMWPFNYDEELIVLCDYYLGYKNFGGSRFTGQYEKFCFFAAPLDEIFQTFQDSVVNERDIDFCLFARHDPNIRNLIATQLRNENSVLAGPLFKNPQASKKAIQCRCKYEFITENEINDYYFSEKIAQSLMCAIVPIYYGCTKIKKWVPPHLFIDFSDFLIDDFEEGTKRIIDYCKDQSNYYKYFDSIRKDALPYLKRYSSLESCMIDPLNRFISTLAAIDFHAAYTFPFVSYVAPFLGRILS